MILSMEAQIQDDFSDGNYTHNPTWVDVSGFFEVDTSITQNLHLSAPSEASEAFIYAPFEAVNDAVWQFYVRLDFNPSSSNFARAYLMASEANFSQDLQGYYLEIGGTEDALTLYKQMGNNHLRIINGPDGWLDQNQQEMLVKVTRSSQGLFELFVDTTMSGNFTYLGSNEDTDVLSASYAGFYCQYTASRSDKFYFDQVLFNGQIPPDNIPPHVLNFNIITDTSLIIQWSEKVWVTDSSVEYALLRRDSTPCSIQAEWISASELLISSPLSWDASAQYTLCLHHLKDKVGNYFSDTCFLFYVPTMAEKGDLVINELLFYSYPNTDDFVELYNKSNKYFQLQNSYFSRTENGRISDLKQIEKSIILPPKHYIVFTTDSIALIEQYPRSAPLSIQSIYSLPSLPKEEGTIVFLNAKQEIIDSFYYHQDMHHPVLQEVQGISLERVSFYANTNQAGNWQSASYACGFATPGLENSQTLPGMVSSHIAILTCQNAFVSPNQDGVEDVLMMSYVLNSAGFIGHINIYHLQGQWIKTIANQEPLSTQGLFLWDGTSDSGTLVPAGWYVIHAQFFSVQRGLITEKQVVRVAY